ncbi:Protein flp [Seminavis robusta]|uniref:Protein flp n=1 Tax=Seminavis robusta TaxID=568900 RepID=A0A9N8HJK6_9STRA|nr:Protein flp [Seminavis robusta]|eukprot:Sro668_g184430.1 Protein flp (498) ;mRNA; f:45174-46667
MRLTAPCFTILVIALLCGPCACDTRSEKDDATNWFHSVTTDPLFWFKAQLSWPKPSKDVFKYLDGVRSVTSLLEGGSHNTTTTPFGYTNIPLKIPMASDSHFPIASNSKLYTTVAIYQLHEQGKLDVEVDIASMLDKQDFENFGLGSSTRPGLGRHHLCPRLVNSLTPWKCEKITLRNLLSMSSGIYPPLNCDAPDNSHSHKLCNPDPYFVNRGSIGKTVGTFIMQPLMFRPGTSYHYSNPNFILAAYFVEKYSGMTFREYLHKNIFGPMGLQHTYYDYFNGALGLDPKRVGQYTRYYDNHTHELLSVGADVLQLDLGVASGTGGIISTVQDHATFWYTLFNKTTMGAPLLSKDSLQAILTPWTFLGERQMQWPNGTKFPVWDYYTQGTFVVCDDAKNCGPDHLRWIMYTGGTETVLTANLLDYRTMKMVQVWTSTQVAMTNRSTWKSIFDRQIGVPRQVVFSLMDLAYNNPMQLALAEMGRDYGQEVQDVLFRLKG